MKAFSSKRRLPRGPFLAALSVVLLGAAGTVAADLHSASVDRAGERIIVRGAGFDGATTVTLGGIAVPTANVTPTTLDLPFGTAVYDALQWRGSYALVADGADRISLYVDAPVEAPEPPPPPPPPPPPGGTECPCTAGWDASGIPRDNFTWCSYGTDGTQNWIIAPRDQYLASAAFDPNDLFFDAAAPENSVSYCVMQEGGVFTVAEPVVNADQYWDCETWLWANVCL